MGTYSEKRSLGNDKKLEFSLLTRHDFLASKITEKLFNEDMEEKINENITTNEKFNQWTIELDGTYYPYRKPYKLSAKINPGYYKIRYNHDRQSFYLRNIEIKTDELLEIPNEKFGKILSDVGQFWNLEKEYINYNFVHKRGILLYGPPGSGKSSLIQLLVKDLIENQKGILLSIDSRDELDYYPDFIKTVFKIIEPNTPIITIIEDIDGYLNNGDKGGESTLLQILDGVNHYNKNITIGTTNYINNLPDRIKNRPSRFDKKYLIDLPTKEDRRFYLENKIKSKDLKNIDIEQWITLTESFTYAHLKELIISVILMKNDLLESISEIKKLVENLDSKQYNPDAGKKIGFN